MLPRVYTIPRVITYRFNSKTQQQLFLSLYGRHISEGLPGVLGTREHWQNIEGNKGTIANFWEQGTKFRRITVRKHSERVWEHGNIGQFWKGTREQGPPPPPLGDPHWCPSEGHQHDVSIQSSIKLGETFLQITHV